MMKHLVSLIGLALIASACTIHVDQLPTGAVACGSDWGCEGQTYCGFPPAGIGHLNLARCMPGSNSKWSYPHEAGR